MDEAKHAQPEHRLRAPYRMPTDHNAASARHHLGGVPVDGERDVVRDDLGKA